MSDPITRVVFVGGPANGVVRDLADFQAGPDRLISGGNSTDGELPPQVRLVQPWDASEELLTLPEGPTWVEMNHVYDLWTGPMGIPSLSDEGVYQYVFRGSY